MMGALEGRVCAVTGAARGIGRAVALAYAAEGAIVYALDRLEDELPEPTDRLRPLPLDVTKADAVAEVFAEIESEAGGADVLVNNAGIIFFKPIEETTAADWDGLMAVNLRGPFLCTRAVAKGLKAKGKGAIINVSSNAGVRGGDNEAAYCASKFGIEGFSRALAVEFGKHGVAVNTITPGHPVRTAMSEITYGPENRKIWKDPGELAPAFVHLALQSPDGIHDRYIRAWDLAQELGEGRA